MRLVLSLLLALLFGGQVFAQDVPTEGSTIKERLVLGRSTFALPPGEWHVVATGSGDVISNGVKAASTVSVYLVQTDKNNEFVAAMFHRLPTSSIATRSWNDSLCDRKHVIYVDAFAGRFDFPECLRIDHYVQWFRAEPKDPFDHKIFSWFRQNRVKLPVTVLNAFYRRYFSGDYVWVHVTVNPEAFGQARSVKTVWAENEWDPLTYEQDPKRKAFVENLTKWAYAMADNARATLRERKPKAAMLPSLEDLRVK